MADPNSPAEDFPPGLPDASARRRNSPQYDERRSGLIWNARLAHSRAPELIACPASTADVARCVRWAGETGMKVALRGSGHNYQGAALRDGGLLLDLGGLDRIEIDATCRRARVGAGVTGGRLIRALAPHGLAFPIGHCADVALSGFVLSGGIGWNYGAWGAACASISAMEMVTAQGDVLHVDARNEPDLFWAAKGAGCAFFAAVTGYELILHEQPAAVLATNMVFDAEAAGIVAGWLEEAAAQADPTVEIICMVGPDLDEGRPSVTVRAVACGADADDVRGKLRAFLTPPAGVPLLSPWTCKALSFAELPKFSAMPSGKRVAADQIWSDEGPAALLRAVTHLAGIPAKSSTISITALGGGARTPGSCDGSRGALSRIGATAAGIYALWDEAADDERHLDWVKAADAALAPHRSARYVGEADLFAAPDRIEDCFSAAALERLRELRERYDPEGRFHSCPAAAGRPAISPPQPYS